MKVLNIVRLLFALEAVFSFVFFYRTSGLGYYDEGDYVLVKSLFSSGSDDDVAIVLMGTICVIIFLILIVKNWSKKAMNWIIAIGFVLQLFALLLIQVGSLIDTIVYGRNFVLLFVVLFQVTILMIAIFKNIENESLT